MNHTLPSPSPSTLLTITDTEGYTHRVDASLYCFDYPRGPHHVVEFTNGNRHCVDHATYRRIYWTFQNRLALTPTPTAHPPVSIPTHYAIHHFEQKCLCCGTTNHWTTAYEIRQSKSSFGGITRHMRQLHIATDLHYRLPIETSHIAPTTVPFCHACYSPTLPPDYPEPPLRAETSLQQEPRPQAAAPSTPVRVAKPASGITLGQAGKSRPDSKRPITLDDL